MKETKVVEESESEVASDIESTDREAEESQLIDKIYNDIQKRRK